MSLDGYPRSKDPFSTLPLPRSFYHPTPTKDVDSNVVIKSQEKKDQLSKKPLQGKPFTTGSTFQLGALPQLKNAFHRNQVPMDHLNTNDSYNETWPKSEQPSDSALMDTSQLTTSLDEMGEDVMRSFFHQEENKSEKSHAQGAPVSVIQKYIERFRYSAPKSREERMKESANRSNTLWWLNSDMTSPEGMKLNRKESARLQSSHLDSRPKLTREAVLELDKETSDLQRKADKLLSKSNLSLASSGPCVSTDGLGSSSAISECSYRTDPQPAYRPIFVNVQEHQPVGSKDKYQEKHSNSEDVLTRWRMRRKMEDVQQQNTHLPLKQKAPRSHNEIDIRLEEFRKKLLAQRVLVTSDEIHFERQRMKILLDDVNEESQHKQTEFQKEKKETPASVLPNEDVVLARLRQITRTDQSHFMNSTGTDIGDKLPNDYKLNGQQNTNDSTSGQNFNLSNVNIIQHDSNSVIISSRNDMDTLNTNNKTSDQVESAGVPRDSGNYCIDEMKSVVLCDAKQNAFALNSDSNSANSIRADLYADSQESSFKKPSVDSECQPECIEKDPRKLLPCKEKMQLFEKDSASDVDVMSEGHAPYHQRLQAEKPCDGANDTEKDKVRQEHHSMVVGSKRTVSYRNKENNVSESSKNECLQKKHEKRCKEDDKEEVIDDISSESSNSGRSAKNLRNKDGDLLRKMSEASQTKTKSAEHKHRASEETDCEIKQHSKSSQQSKIHKAIGETIVDHLFDGPSIISSVDSWASLFPQSPMHSHSFHNPAIVTPPRDQITSTPQNTAIEEPDDSDHNSIEELTHDPLMTLLLQQKNEYIRKLELIELKLQQLDEV